MKHLTTRFVHPEGVPDRHGATVPPIYRSVSYHQTDPWHHVAYDYARSGNPTRAALESAIADLEHGARGLAFASGNAALTAVGLLFAAGDHLIVTHDCQGGTMRLLDGVFSRFGVSATYVDTRDLDAVQQAMRPQTRGLWVENFSNPFLQVADIPALAGVAHRQGWLFIVDNTLVTPVFQNPLELGADVVVHSATKAIAGHGDITAGLAVCHSPEWGDRLYAIQNATGMILSPDDAYTVLRGLDTLPLRIAHASKNAERLAAWLAAQPGVEGVYYPGLPDDPGYPVASKTMRGYGQVLTVRMRDPNLKNWLPALQLISVGAGFGATRSMISLPPLHCHACLDTERRSVRHLDDRLLRLSVGLEDSEDLIADIEQAWRIAAV